MKKLLGILVLSLLFCSNGLSVESLKEGQKGKIKFQSIPLITLNQFLKGDFDHSNISKWSWGSVHGKMGGPPIKISGPILEKNVNYDFIIELRTIYDKSNWVFSLDNFHVEVIP